jgi:hypothetical protein
LNFLDSEKVKRCFYAAWAEDSTDFSYQSTPTNIAMFKYFDDEVYVVTTP